MNLPSKTLLLALAVSLVACAGDDLAATVEEGPTTTVVVPDVGAKHMPLTTTREGIEATILRVRLEKPIDASKLDVLAKHYVDVYGGARKPEVEVRFYLREPESLDEQPWAVSTVGKTVSTRILGTSPR